MNEKFVDQKLKITSEIFPTKKPKSDLHISITYLDDSNYNFEHIVKIGKGNHTLVKDLQRFISKAREYKSIDELIKNHKPHSSIKNKDSSSERKIKELRDKYNLEIDYMCHIHCKRNGNGQVVLHGFRIGNNFEIVWIDLEHNVHSV